MPHYFGAKYEGEKECSVKGAKRRTSLSFDFTNGVFNSPGASNSVAIFAVALGNALPCGFRVQKMRK